jgi:hypothetical protein
MIRDRYDSAYSALCRLRPSTLQAARDLYYIHAPLKIEEKLRDGKQLWREMFTILQNRRAEQSCTTRHRCSEAPALVNAWPSSHHRLRNHQLGFRSSRYIYH